MLIVLMYFGGVWPEEDEMKNKECLSAFELQRSADGVSKPSPVL